MSVLDKLKKLVSSKKIGIRYNVDPSKGIGLRGGEFIELVVLDSSSQFNKSISEVPLEAGKEIVENMKISPRTVNMKVLISDYNSGIISSSIASSALIKLGAMRGDVATKLDLFELIHQAGLVCDISLMTRNYQNMQLMSYSFTEDPQNKGRYLMVDMNFQEMMFFSTAKVSDNKKINLQQDGGAGLKNNFSIFK